MLHSNTELLIDYWRSRLGERRLPLRRDIDPSGFAAQAHRVFMATREPGGDVRFRLAGEALIELHGKPLRGESLIRLWRPQCRWRLMSLARTCLAAARPTVVMARSSAVSSADLEVLFAPLAGPDGEARLLLGHYQPLTTELPGPVRELEIEGVVEMPGFAQTSHLRLAAVDGRRIA